MPCEQSPPILGTVKHGHYVDAVFAVPVHDHVGQSRNYNLTRLGDQSNPAGLREIYQVIDSSQHAFDNRLRSKRAGDRNVIPNVGEVADR